ncbi:MAG TPA: hypothetical protein VHA75_15110, partial [Rugosimonospora sp.]|nr:hypothetical protein [Rugosimonospora sp.]
DWRATGGQVWWSLAGPEPVIGRLQGGIDALQAMLSGGREQALIEDLLSSNGMRFYLVNPMGWLLSDVVELTVRMELLSTPEIVDFIPDNGLENYLHGYTEVSRSRGRDSTQAYTVAKAGLGGTHGTSGGPEVHLGGGQHRSTKQADENIVEQTVYDWTGHYRARVRHRLLIDVRRVKMAGRGINNQLATWVRNRSGVQPVHRHHDGELILKIPRGLAEAAPVFGPAPPPSFTPLPPLPADSLVSAVLLDDALPTAEHLMRVAFGESADTAEFRTSLSLPLLLSRSHLGGHLLKALAGKTHTLATDLFVPGHSSDRAELSMSGDLYDMQVISRVDNTGTGRYAKYLSTTSANVANDRWNTSVVGGVDQGGTTEVLDPQNADKPWAHNAADSSTGAARQAPPGIAGGGANNPRREQHIKQQGQVYLVKVRGRFFLELARFRHEVTGDPRPLGAITSEPITGDIFLEMFADEIEEMRRYLDLHHLTAATEAPPAWDGVDITREDEDLDVWLTRAAVAGANAWEAPVDVARMLREPRTRQRPLRLTIDAGARAYQIHEAIAEWEIASLRATDRATANLRQAELDAAGAALRAEATTLANGLALLTKRINTIIARVSLARRARQGPRPLPPVVPVLSIDPVQAARQIAQELDTYVEVVESFPGGGQAIHRVDRLGRIFRVHADGTPFTLDEAIRLLPGELQRRIRTERLGRAVLVDLYQNSWIRQQSFEQAVSAALGPPPPVVRPPGKVTKPDPSLPPPKDPPVKAPLFGSPTSGSPTSGSPTSGSP